MQRSTVRTSPWALIKARVKMTSNQLEVGLAYLARCAWLSCGMKDGNGICSCAKQSEISNKARSMKKKVELNKMVLEMEM